MNPPFQADVPNPYVIDIPPEFAPTAVHPMRVRAAQYRHRIRCRMRGRSSRTRRAACCASRRPAQPGWCRRPAIWVPPRVTHEVVIVEEAYLRTLYIDGRSCRTERRVPRRRGDRTPARADRRTRRARPEHHARAPAVRVLDELSHAEPLPLAMPAKKAALCESVLAHPAHAESLEHWASEVGASTRTISRLFKQELGVSFSQWRQQALLARPFRC